MRALHLPQNVANYITLFLTHAQSVSTRPLLGAGDKARVVVGCSDFADLVHSILKHLNKALC